MRGEDDDHRQDRDHVTRDNLDPAKSRDGLSPLETLARQLSPAQPSEAQLRQFVLQPDLLLECVRLAEGHGVGTLFSARLRPIWDELPDEVKERMAAHERAKSARNMLLDRELARALQALKNEGLDVLIYKGPALANLAYGSTWAREYGDVDFLVHEADIVQAYHALDRAGFEPEFRPSATFWPRLLRMTKELPFRGRAGSVVELHWNVLPRWFPGVFELEPTWQSAQLREQKKVECLAPSVEEMVVILCIHGMTHRWDSLRWLADIAWLVDRHPNLDWTHVSTRAASFGGLRLVRIGLGLAAKAFHLPIPEELAIQSDSEAKVVAQLYTKLHHPDRGLRWLAARLWLSLSMVEGRRARIVALWRVLGVKKTDLLEYPDLARFWPLYLVLRPFRLLRHYLGRELAANEDSSSA